MEGGDAASANSLACGDDRSVDRTKRKVSVGCHQLRNSKPIGWGNLFGHQLARRQVAEEAHLGVRTDSSSQQVGDLGDDQNRHQDWPRVALEKSPAPAVLGIISVVGRVKRSASAISGPLTLTLESLRSDGRHRFCRSYRQPRVDAFHPRPGESRWPGESAPTQSFRAARLRGGAWRRGHPGA